MIEENLGTILLVTGVLTTLAGIGVVMPRQTLGSLLGYKASDETTILIGRHWSLLFVLVGGLLIYAAYHPEIRVPIMIVAATEKLALGVFVLASPLRKRPQTMAVVGADAIMALLYILALAQRGLA